MTVAVVTSCYGSYDQLPPVPEQSIGARWICVSDREWPDTGWEVVVEPRPHMHPRLAAKVAKCLPFAYAQREDTTVWMDASCRLLVPDALEQIVAAAEGHRIAQVPHPDRDCVFDEAEFCVPIPKYQGQPMLAQVASYREKGYPAHAGLFATGLIVRNAPLAEFGRRWLVEQMYWSYQDQLSEMPLVASMQIEGEEVHVQPLPFALRGNGVFEWRAHASEL